VVVASLAEVYVTLVDKPIGADPLPSSFFGTAFT
jgi:hypothetical protein